MGRDMCFDHPGQEAAYRMGLRFGWWSDYEGYLLNFAWPLEDDEMRKGMKPKAKDLVWVDGFLQNGRWQPGRWEKGKGK